MEGHSTIESIREYEPDVFNTFLQLHGLKILQGMYELIRAFATKKFCSS